MFRQTKHRLTNERRNFAESNDKIEYPFRLNMYDIPPIEEITLTEFEQWSLDRLKVLSEIESCSVRSRSEKETFNIISNLINKYLKMDSNFNIDNSNNNNNNNNNNNLKLLEKQKFNEIENQRKKDHISHYILRLVFCRTSENRKRFIKTESTLFKIRYEMENSQVRQEFIQSLNLDVEQVSNEEKISLKDKLSNAFNVSIQSIEQENFFKVDFERVIDLVESRKILLIKGKAYVPNSYQISLILAEFSKRLNNSLELTARALPRLEEDDRLIPILNHMAKGFTTTEYIIDNSVISPQDINAKSIDNLSKFFPLCMLNLHKELKINHHLRYFGRQQYSLFLKGIGLNVEEAIIFWRQSFSTMTDDKFKEHKYNIRHTYGLEGSKHNYRPYSCQTILTSNPPGPNDAHGCPYRHFSLQNLKNSLQRMGVNDSNTLSKVQKDVANKQYHVACTRVFDFLNADAIKDVTTQAAANGNSASVAYLKETISHPNMYFERAYTLAKRKNHTKLETSEG